MSDNPWATRGEYNDRIEREKLLLQAALDSAKATQTAARWARWAAIAAGVAAVGTIADDGQLPVDNNWIENQIRPIAIGRSNWLFAGSLRAGQRAAAVMSLIQSARMNGHDPWAYINDVLRRLPTQPNSRIAELLPHQWHPTMREA